VYDEDDIRVASEELTLGLTGEFEFEVPEEAASESYLAVVIVQTEGGVLVWAENEVTLLEDYELQVWVGKSKYASGEFKPGATISIHYNIIAASGVQLPVYKLRISADFDPIDHVFLVSDPEGSVEYTLADDAPTGELWFSAYLYDGYDEDMWSSLDYDYGQVQINNRLSAWDRSIGGMAASDFLIMLLIVIMILLLIILPFLKSRMGAPKAAKVEPPPPTPPQ
jgi:hypothetical protein